MRLKSRNKCLFYKPTPTPLNWRGSNRNLFLDFKRITLVNSKLTLNNFNAKKIYNAEQGKLDCSFPVRLKNMSG